MIILGRVVSSSGNSILQIAATLKMYEQDQYVNAKTLWTKQDSTNKMNYTT